MPTRSTARLVVSLVLVAGLVALGGCFKSQEEATVKKDGTGTAKVTMTIDMSKMEALKEMMAGMGMGEGEGMPGDPLEDFDPEDMKKQLEGKEGVRLVSARRVVDDEKKTVTVIVELAFDSLEALFKSGGIQNVDVKLEKNDDGSYTFTRTMGGDMLPAEDMGDDPESAEMVKAMLGMFEPVMGDMEAKASLTLPTPILETNGEKVGESQVTWKVGFKDISNPEKRKQVVKFSGAGLDWKPFAVTAADVEEVEIDEPEMPEEEEVDEPEPVTPGK